MKSILKAARRLAECLAFWLLTPAWLVALARGLWMGRGAGRGSFVRQAARRWGRYLLAGLDDVRREWWIQLKLESAADVWRYVLLAELFALQNTPAVPIASPINKVLIVRLGHLGDILQTVPLAREWKRQRPGVAVHLLCGPWSEKFASAFSCFDRCIAYAPRVAQFNRDMKNGTGIVGEIEFLRTLRAEGYDTVVSTSPKQLIDLVLQQAVFPPVWLGAAGGPTGFPEVGRPIVQAFDSRMTEARWVNSFLALVGLEPGSHALEYPLTPELRSEADAILRSRSLQFGPVVALAPGAGWPGKCWPAERFAEVADDVIRRQGAAIVLVGSAAERTLADEVISKMVRPAVNLAGETSLGVLAALLERCVLLVCNDSAPLHIAAAVGTPTLSLFGPTFASKWAPEGEQHLFVQSGYDCAGCWYWHVRAACVHGRECMRRISAIDVGDRLSAAWPQWVAFSSRRGLPAV